MNKDQVVRLQAKTPEQRFLNMLEKEFNQAPRIAQVILADAQSCLLGSSKSLKPGQMRVVLAARGAGHGRALRATPTKEVVWTVDAGEADYEVGQGEGYRAMRRQRILRLLDEALAQGGVATQEDLARVLNVSPRTIKRDCVAMRAQGISLPTRGNLQGIGRGQTHKREIVGRWLGGETYDQISRHTHHHVTSVQRYVQAFVRVVQLHQRDLPGEEIALLLQLSRPLVAEYLAIYQEHDAPLARQRLSEQLQRLNHRPHGAKKGVE
jgi:biotin operon repressor